MSKDWIDNFSRLFFIKVSIGRFKGEINAHEKLFLSDTNINQSFRPTIRGIEISSLC